MALTASRDPAGRINECVVVADGEGTFCTHDVTLAAQEELIARLVVSLLLPGFTCKLQLSGELQYVISTQQCCLKRN